MREFKDSVSGNSKDTDEPGELSPPTAAGAGFCSSCGARLTADAQFCASCGTPVATAAPSAGTREAATIEHDG